MSTSSSSSSISAASAASGDGTIPSASAPVTILTNGTTSISQLFPTPTGYNANNNPSGKKLNVYYLVFLGILGALVVLACLLTVRSYRLRRQYRSAAQLAIARGEPFPPDWWQQQRQPTPADELWGGGIYTGGPPPGPLSEWAIVGGRAPHGGRRERRWVRIPVLWDAKPVPEVEEEVDAEPAWASWGQPLTLHSLNPAPELRRPVPPPLQPPPVRPSVWRRNRAPPPPPPAAPVPKLEPEIERAVGAGEPMRVAVVIQMPGYERRIVDDEDDDDDETVGWEPGMELGVWTGAVSPGAVPEWASYTPSSTTHAAEEKEKEL